MKISIKGKNKKAFIKELFSTHAWSKQARIRAIQYRKGIEDYKKEADALGYEAARAAGYLVKQPAKKEV